MIPVCKPWLPGNEKKYVDEAVDTNWISSSGKFIDQFEEKFAAFCGSQYGVSCSSGLGALHLACAAIGLKKGDEVIVPTFTMAATINAVIFTGATPVFVDADKETWCMDVTKISEKITDNTKAIIPVHVYGHACDMDIIMDLASKHNLKVIEDAAEAHGGEYKGKKCGSIGDIGCFSFYANKILTTGEGGMCVTNDEMLSEEMKKLRNHAFEHPRFIHKQVGFNYRLTNIQAGIGVAQTENADKLVEARRSLGKRYGDALKGLPLVLPVEKEGVKSVYWMYGVVLDDSVSKSKDDVMAELKEKGVDTRSFFIPMHTQPVYVDKTVENAPDCSGAYPVADWLGSNGFYLPSSSDITDEEIETVVKVLKEVLNV
jgi:perosamine synthetase